MRSGLWWVLPCAALLLSLSSVPTASAQTDGARAEARVHFERGLDLFDEGRLIEALAEFEEAYRISPAPALLYNVAQIHADLGHAVEAADAYERFLRDSPSLDPELRADAERALRVQRARIGRVEVTVSVEGTRLFVDDVEVGTSPLSEPIQVSAGEHVVVAQIAGFETQRHRFRLAGGATYRVELVLVPSGSRGASLRVESIIPGVEVRVDGASLGLTPLDATVPVSGGAHRVEGTRDGYVPFALEVTAVDGSETRVVVQTRPDPTAPASTRAALRIALPSASTTVRLDGEVIDASGGLEVPVGLHDLEIRAAEREPVDERIDVVPEVGLSLEPAYAWTPDAREARVSAAAGQRDTGVLTLVLGAVAVVAGGGVLVGALVWYDQEFAALSVLEGPCANETAGSLSDACRAAVRDFTGVDPTYDDYVTLIAPLNDVPTYYALIGVGAGLAGLGAISMAVGIGLFVSAPSEDDIDRGARADFTLQLDLGVDHFGVRGTF